MSSGQAETGDAAAADAAMELPFLPSSVSALSVRGFGCGRLEADGAPGAAWREAVRRVSCAERGKPYAPHTRAAFDIGGRPYPALFLTYVLSLLLCRAAGNRTLTRRFALAEAVRAEPALRRSMSAGTLDVRVQTELFGTPVSRDDGGAYWFPVFHYVTLATKFGAREWELVNQDVSRGSVRLDVARLVRLAREASAARIVAVVEGLPSGGRLSAEASRHASGLGLSCRPSSVKKHRGRADWPPCIRHAVVELARGRNLPHSGRFLLASYLLRTGMAEPDIVSFFRGAPDFDAGVTAYQVRQIAGVGYACPGCGTVEAAGGCHREEGGAACARISNPLYFRSRRGGAR